MRSRRVLVADDDPFIRDLLRIRLQGMGCDVVLARDGEEVLLRLESGAVDGMILDINMPKVDGLGVLEELRRRGRGLPPVLMLTARHAAEDILLALDLGAKDYLGKPFTERQLAVRLQRLLRPRPAPVPRCAESPPEVRNVR